MSGFLAFLLIAGSISLCGWAIIPRKPANRFVVPIRNAVTGVVALQFLLSISTLLLLLARPASAGRTQLALSYAELSFLFDGISLLMLCLVNFVGWAICRYSIRYLDGESSQANFYQWAAFTVGCVSNMVIAGNLLQLVLAWILTSIGLHRLLLYYPDRIAAQRAAWTKFTVSRIGDVALIVATVLVYREFKSFQLFDIFSAADSAQTQSSVTLQISALLFAVGAITKSAQFPFHTWLPLTMETPTPVSALMHAGVVNAGGFLLVRLSPLVQLSSAAMLLIASVGCLTACYGSIVMTTQTSIKKKLAYSTVAQMGFMLMQCGLGAYSAAMLHIIAHSIYKAYAFLASGDVLTNRALKLGSTASKKAPSLLHIAGWSMASMVLIWCIMHLLGIDVGQKPGGVVLAVSMAAGLAYWQARTTATFGWKGIGKVASLSLGLVVAYSLCYAGVDSIVEATPQLSESNAWTTASYVLPVCIICILLAFQILLSNYLHRPAVHRLRVHASNGFYVESLLRRCFGTVLTS